MGKKKGKSTGAEPWHRAYKRLNLSQLITGVIRKRMRSLLRARARLKQARTAKAANVERRHIMKCLADIDVAYSEIRKAFCDRGHMQRWREFPDLQDAVRQVDNIDWSEVQTKRLPGGPFKPRMPKFDDEPSASSEAGISSNHSATGANGVPVRKHVKEKIKVEEEDDIEEGEIVIKDEEEDEPGVPLGIRSPERLPSPEPVDLDRETQAQPHQLGYLYPAGLGDTRPGLPAHLMSQSTFSQPYYPANYWYALPNHYGSPESPAFYAVVPYYNPASIPFASEGSIGNVYTQLPYGGNHSSPTHEALQRSGLTLPAPPGAFPGAFLPVPSFPPPSAAPKSPILRSKPRPVPRKPSAPPSSPMVANKAERERAGKRKRANSQDSWSGTDRPIKRHASARGCNSFGAYGSQDGQSKPPRSESGPPDFGTWFQEQVAGSKKKLSQLERTSTPAGSTKPA